MDIDITGLDVAARKRAMDVVKRIGRGTPWGHRLIFRAGLLAWAHALHSGAPPALITRRLEVDEEELVAELQRVAAEAPPAVGDTLETPDGLCGTITQVEELTEEEAKARGYEHAGQAIHIQPTMAVIPFEALAASQKAPEVSPEQAPEQGPPAGP
jgi:hypothetical protein